MPSESPSEPLLGDCAHGHTSQVAIKCIKSAALTQECKQASGLGNIINHMNTVYLIATWLLKLEEKFPLKETVN